MSAVEAFNAVVEAIPRAELWGIGRYAQRDRRVDYPISHSDFDRDLVWTTEVVREWGVSAGDVVAVVYAGFEAPWFAQVVDALNAVGAAVCQVEPAAYEAPRAKMLLRRFPIGLVVGLDAQLAGALDRDCGLGEAMAGVSLLLVRPDAYDLARELPVDVGLVAPVGPTLALACAGAAGLHVNEEEWTLASTVEGLVISSRCDRAHRIDRAPLHDSRIAIASDGRCRCGRALSLRVLEPRTAES